MNKLIILLLSLLLTSCAPGQLPRPTLTTTPMPIMTSSKTPTHTPSSPTLTNTLLPSDTLIAPTRRTSTSTPTVTVTEAYRSINRNCMPIEDMPPETELQGVLALFNNYHGPYFLDLSDFTRHAFPISPDANLSSGPYLVSPDRKWLAYIENYVDERGAWKSLKLRLINADGQRDLLSYWYADWQDIIAWMDNDKLILSLPKRPQGAVTILEPFTGQWYEYSPSILVDNPNTESIFSSIGDYDPTFRYVLLTSYKHNTLRLWDTQAQDTIWLKEVSGWSKPLWSPNSEYFVYSTQDTIINLVSNTGEEIQIFDLQRSRIPFRSYSAIRNYSWSPDSTNLAVWAGDPPQLIIINIVTQEIIDLCLTGDWFPPPPLWSPDGQYLAVQIEDEDNRWSEDMVIVSLKEGYAFKIAEEVIAVGWLVKP